MAIRVPRKVIGDRQVSSVPELVTNQDIAPTLLDLIGVEPCTAADVCREQDGRSLAGLIRGEQPAWSRDRAILVEQGSAGCKYAGIRTPGWLYNQTLKLGGDGECGVTGSELYDLRRDPDELENIAGRSPEERDLKRRLEALRECAGTTGPSACE